MKNVLITLLFGLLALSTCRADDWQRADIYFVDWYVSSRIPFTPERVRRLAEHKHTFRRGAPAVAHLLELSKLKPARDKTQEDARLVIDLLDDTMQRHTFYASMFNLCSADNKRKRAIDDKFRERLTRLATQHKTK